MAGEAPASRPASPGLRGGARIGGALRDGVRFYSAKDGGSQKGREAKKNQVTPRLKFNVCDCLRQQAGLSTLRGSWEARSGCRELDSGDFQGAMKAYVLVLRGNGACIKKVVEVGVPIFHRCPVSAVFLDIPSTPSGCVCVSVLEGFFLMGQQLRHNACKTKLIW